MGHQTLGTRHHLLTMSMPSYASASVCCASCSAIMLFLFGVVYRYAVRSDSNPMLKQGVVGAFVITRSWALITPPATCDLIPLNCGAPLGYFNWDMIGQGVFGAAETGAACVAAAFAIETCFSKGWIKKSTIE